MYQASQHMETHMSAPELAEGERFLLTRPPFDGRERGRPEKCRIEILADKPNGDGTFPAKNVETEESLRVKTEYAGKRRIPGEIGEIECWEFLTQTSERAGNSFRHWSSWERCD